MENLCYKMCDEPEIVDAVLDHIVDYYFTVSRNIFDTAADVIDIFFIGNDLGIAHSLPFVIFEYGDAFRDECLCLHLVGAPHLAAHTVPHRILGTEKPGQKIRRATYRSGTVARTSLPEDGQVRCDGEVACHTDFLASCYTHSIDSADNRFLAH